MGLSCTVFKLTSNLLQVANLSHPCLFSALAKWFPLKLGNGAWAQKKTEGRCYLAVKKFDSIFSRLDIIHECDRQTDGHRPTASTVLMHSNAW